MKTNDFAKQVLEAFRGRLRSHESPKDISRDARAALEVIDTSPESVPEDEIERFFAGHPAARSVEVQGEAEEREREVVLARIRRHVGKER